MLSEVFASVEGFYNRGELPPDVLLDLAYFTVREVERRKNYSHMATKGLWSYPGYGYDVNDSTFLPPDRLFYITMPVPTLKPLKAIIDIWPLTEPSGDRQPIPLERVDYRRLKYLEAHEHVSDSSPLCYALGNSARINPNGGTEYREYQEIFFWPELQKVSDSGPEIDYYGFSEKITSLPTQVTTVDYGSYWLDTVAPDVMIYGILSKMHMYSFEDARAGNWLKFYAQAMKDLSNAEVNKQESGRTRHMADPGARGVGR